VALEALFNGVAAHWPTAAAQSAGAKRRTVTYWVAGNDANQMLALSSYKTY